MTYRFEFRRYALPFCAPVRTAHGPWAAREGVYVRLENESGVSAVGEAAPIPWFGTETIDEVLDACRRIGPITRDEELAAVPEHAGCLRNALAAAVSEIRANVAPKAGEAPPADVFRADASSLEVPYRAVAALLPTGRAAIPEVIKKSEAGFRVFKWKVGVAELADELSLLDDLCAELPPGAKLRLDANGAWDRRRTERCLERCAERPIEFLEQPIAPDVRGVEDLLVGLSHDFPTPIALDESVVGESDLERWLGLGWRGVFVVKPALVQNVDRAMEKLAKANADVVFSSALETAVGARAALKHAFRWDGKRRALGFGVWPLFVDERFNGPAAAPFLYRDEVERINPTSLWNALS